MTNDINFIDCEHKTSNHLFINLSQNRSIMCEYFLFYCFFFFFENQEILKWINRHIEWMCVWVYMEIETRSDGCHDYRRCLKNLNGRFEYITRQDSTFRVNCELLMYVYMNIYFRYELQWLLYDSIIGIRVSQERLELFEAKLCEFSVGNSTSVPEKKKK